MKQLFVAQLLISLSRYKNKLRCRNTICLQGQILGLLRHRTQFLFLKNWNNRVFSAQVINTISFPLKTVCKKGLRIYFLGSYNMTWGSFCKCLGY